MLLNITRLTTRLKSKTHMRSSLTIIGWTAMKFGADIHGVQRMKINVISRLTFVVEN